MALEEDKMMWKILFIIFYHVHLADNIYIYIYSFKKDMYFFQH